MPRKIVLLTLLILLPTTLIIAANKEKLRKTAFALLDAHCPDGAFIVHTSYEKLSFMEGNDFTNFISDGEDEVSVLNSLNTVVHEELHGLNGMYGPVFLQEKLGGDQSDYWGYEYYYLNDRQYILVKKTTTFPSREMVNTFPKELRTLRFDYVDNNDDVQSTQGSGIYGLLDEMNAYYQGTRASYDLLSWYEPKGQAADWPQYFQNINGTLYGCMEFKLYFLKYLLFARQNQPDIYKGLMNNKNFLLAYVRIEQNVANFYATYTMKKQEIFSKLRGYGWKVEEKEDMLFIDKGGSNVGHGTFMDVYNLLNNEMKKPVYQTLHAEIKNLVKDWNPESIYASLKEVKDVPLPPPTEPVKDEPVEDNPPVVVTEPEPGELRIPKVPGDDYQGGERIAVLNDTMGDVKYKFVDILAGSITKKEQNIIFILECMELPFKFSFNSPALEENAMEYEWAVYLDIDGNGREDYSVSLCSFKFPGAKPVTTVLLDQAQASFWKLSGSGGETVDLQIEAFQSNDSIVFVVPAYPYLNKIRNQAKFRFSASYNNGKDSVYDNMPE
ncbi:MAG TPA: hypothetical protein PLP19_03925 [bacterium]|nr:hypothetical protein [bacterium]HPN42616.1 hypothetical protein [bacterium]